MNGTSIAGLAAGVVAVLLISGCASGTPAAETGAEPDATSAPSPSAEPSSAEPSEPEASDYADCPPTLIDTLNSASSGSTSWESATWDDVPLGEAIDAPVPSCSVARGGDWTQSFYVGGDQALFDQLGSSLTELGLPEYVTDNPLPGSKSWGTSETGIVTVTMITPGDIQTILGPIFTEPAVELEALGDPLP